MPALDQCHPQVIRALEQDGWRLEQAPLFVPLSERRAYIDALLSRGDNGFREQLLLLEIKCFVDPKSVTPEIYGAIGQYLVYRVMIRAKGWDYPLYLSVPVDIYDKHFDTLIQEVLQTSRIDLVIVDLGTERVSKWIMHSKT